MSDYRRLILVCSVAVAITVSAIAVVRRVQTIGPEPDENGIYHVYPGENIQAALDAAAGNRRSKHVQVHEGVFRPQRHGQALIWFNKVHDGITLEAIGNVTLTAANQDLAIKTDPTYPAVVNHVVYFGDGITRKTVLRGFKITGANGYASTSEANPIEPSSGLPQLQKAMFFYTDGGGIKIFGRSYPTIEGVEVHDNFVSPCGAGVSVEHRGFTESAVLLKDCIFRNNKCTVTGSAVDVLNASSAEIENCLFVGNLSNTHDDERVKVVGHWKPVHGSGALTVFPESRVVVRNCTFVSNCNGVDDSSTGNRYETCIFWKNVAPGGWATGRRYELDVADGGGVRNCHLQGDLIDLNGNIDRQKNVFECKDPQFDEDFVPRADGFEGVGYRPVTR